MTVDELMKQVQGEMGDDPRANLKKISEIADTLRKEPNAAELLEALAAYAYAQMPAEDRAAMEETTFAAGKRMDQTFADAQKLIGENKPEEAAKLLGAISEKIEKYFENGDTKWFSFRNPFEYHMYRYFYPKDTNFERAPFDFAHYLVLYAYTLIEIGETRKAREALLRAILFNPVGADIRFEYAELCKFAKNMPDLLDSCRVTARIATSADRMARVCANLGYYCEEMGELYAAAVFYFESMRFLPSKPVETALQDVVRHMKTEGMKFVPPTKEQITATYTQFGVPEMPNSELINLALVLAKQAKEYKRLDLEGLFYRVAFDMTNNPEFKSELDRIDRAIAAAKAEE